MDFEQIRRGKWKIILSIYVGKIGDMIQNLPSSYKKDQIYTYVQNDMNNWAIIQIFGLIYSDILHKSILVLWACIIEVIEPIHYFTLPL